MKNTPKILSNDLDQVSKTGERYESELNDPLVHKEIIQSFAQHEKLASLVPSRLVLSYSMAELEKVRNSIDLIRLKPEDPYFQAFQEHMKFYYLLITKRPFDFDPSRLSQHHLRFRVSPTELGILNKSLNDYMINFKNFNVHDFADIYEKKLNDLKSDYEKLIQNIDVSNLNDQETLFKKKNITQNMRGLCVELWMVSKAFLEQSLLYNDNENEKFIRGWEESSFNEIKKIDDILKNLN